MEINSIFLCCWPNRKKTNNFFSSFSHWLYDYVGPCEMNYLKVNNISKNCVPLKDLPSHSSFSWMSKADISANDTHRMYAVWLWGWMENGAQGRLYMNDYLFRIIYSHERQISLVYLEYRGKSDENVF